MLDRILQFERDLLIFIFALLELRSITVTSMVKAEKLSESHLINIMSYVMDI